MHKHFEIPSEHYETKPYEAKESNYLLSPELYRAVELAIRLHKPLLITGEPGTGKTRLAHKLAHDLNEANQEHFYPKPLIFNTKTTSLATDLFYTYDAVRHFHDANIRKAENSETESQEAPPIAKYIHLQALGKAIVLSDEAGAESKRYLDPPEEKPKSSVVLIDEIDKAPRDFPNDILNELENYCFQIKEANLEVTKGKKRGIIIILTSNSEKSLPDAFLRRVVFYHIPFPQPEQLVKIVRSQLETPPGFTEEELIAHIKHLVDHFMKIRQEADRKLPATAELLAWVHFLNLKGFFRKGLDLQKLNPDDKQALRQSYSLLAKTRVDLEKIQERFTKPE